MKSFDKEYFDKWYRSRAHRVRSGAALRRQVALTLAIAEYVLERPVRSVLDIGCGEGEWEVALHAVRPRARYAGVEPSAYAVAKFGGRRNITQGTFGAMAAIRNIERYDLVVCSDVLHYVKKPEIVRGANVLGKRLKGVALLHAFTAGDDIEGDLKGLMRRPASWYRKTFRKAGLHELGLGCWAPKPLKGMLSKLESA